jgi:hypothetical protein
VVDGEKPLEFELDITFAFRNSNPFLDQYPICFNGILKAFQGKKIQTNLIPIKHKAKPFVRGWDGKRRVF